MTAEQWSTLLVWIAVPGANLLPLLYGISAPWQRSLVGWALMFSKVGLAGLVDTTFIYHLKRTLDYRLHDFLVLGSFALIVVGTYLYLVAFVRAQYIKRHY